MGGRIYLFLPSPPAASEFSPTPPAAGLGSGWGTPAVGGSASGRQCDRGV